MSNQVSGTDYEEINEQLRDALIERDEELSDRDEKIRLLETELENIREDCYIAVGLLENPVFSTDMARAIEILRAIAEERN